MEYVPGIKINRIKALDQLGVDRKRLGRYAVESYLEQILSHGFFHADPHPGNIAVDDVNGGRLIFYDFGMMGSISPNIREGLLEVFYGVHEKDAEKVLQAMVRMGVLVPTGDMTAVRRTAQFFLNRICAVDFYYQWLMRTHDEDKEISFEERLAAQRREREVATAELGFKKPLTKEEKIEKKKQRLAAIGEDLLAIAADQPFRFPATFTFVVRAFSVLDGIGKGLDPRFDITEIAKPYALELLRFREAGVEDFRKRWDRQSQAFYNLFRQADRVEKLAQTIQRLEQGDLKLRVGALESERAFQRVAAVQNTIGSMPAIIAYCLCAYFGLKVLIGIVKGNASMEIVRCAAFTDKLETLPEDAVVIVFVPRGLFFAKFGSNLTAFFDLAFPICIDAHAPASSNAIAIDQRGRITRGSEKKSDGIVEQLNHSQILVACARYRFFTSNTPFKYTERTKGTRMLTTSNEFEKKLLAETHPPPGDIGITFDGIGAFGNVKETLKELVMLPRQRPILFWKGLLTKPPLVGEYCSLHLVVLVKLCLGKEKYFVLVFRSCFLVIPCFTLQCELWAQSSKTPLLLSTRQSKDGYFSSTPGTLSPICIDAHAPASSNAIAIDQSYKLKKTLDFYREVHKYVQQEIDYTKEAANAEQFADNFKNMDYVNVPTILGSIQPHRLGRYAVESYLERILSHGFFHADPHPGNIAVDDVNGGRLIFYDFGMMGSISPNIREGLLEVFYGVHEKDAERAPRSTKKRERSGNSRTWFKKPLTKEEKIEKKKQRLAAIGEDLLAIAADQPFRFSRHFSLSLLELFRVLDGIGKGLDPRFDITEIAKPSFMSEIYGVHRSKL
ncbi:UNVERIFIED_CONTAM: protein ACTIVITY OF BC1 COMPLEX kinase, chloroplastic [Sesamum calycinum]|uniref:Protein ACTIVITY OF BC1 COMPLEX kinase, chloroplastic n=1 Tax=Sesamum calycinum TaxID=2727403 RepID=A0AAW2K2G8_9LAMI